MVNGMQTGGIDRGWERISTCKLSWDDISFCHRRPLIVIDDIFTPQLTSMKFYDKQLVSAQRYLSQFQLDNARLHSARLTTAFLRHQDIGRRSWF